MNRKECKGTVRKGKQGKEKKKTKQNRKGKERKASETKGKEHKTTCKEKKIAMILVNNT